MPGRVDARAAASSVISSLRSTRSVGSSPFLVSTRGSGSGAAASRPTRRRWKAPLLVARLAADDPAAFLGAAVVVAGDDVLRDVDQAPGQVPGVGRAQGGVGEALAGAVGGDEVLEDGHALAEVAPHRDVDDPTGRVGHQAAHRAQLADVALVPAGAGGGHHRDRAVRVERPHHLVGHLASWSPARPRRPARSARPR